jgi:2-polyprenyl-3-methyl-5-hydroxy-6-metoxy-1,4-benzoquinol methylase
MKPENKQKCFALYDYKARQKQRINRCNLCDAEKFTIITHSDRYTFGASANACDNCGLVFLNPVMTAAEYSHFYARTYRPLVSAYHGRLIDAHTIQDEQQEYAEALCNFLEPHFEGKGFKTLLDVGGSTGVVARALAKKFGLKATVLDPAADELACAQAEGITIAPGFIEDFKTAERFDAIIVCQTIDHFLDAHGAMRKLHELLNPNGILFLDIVDFRAAYLRNWSLEEAVKIDHPYYFTQETAIALFKRTGFQVIQSNYAADHLHVGYICRPATPDFEALPARAATEKMFEEIRFVHNVRRPARG